MKKQIIVGIPTLHCYDKLIRLCDHLLNDSHPCIEAKAVIIDNGGQMEQQGALDALNERCGGKFDAVQPAYNLGVAKSWNVLIRSFGRCIIANDDTVFGLNDIAKFLEAAEQSPETVIFETAHPIGGFSTFFVNKPEEWLAMGGFDELLSPAYFEDNDCRWRLKLAGKPVVPVELEGWSHDNSSTLHSGSIMHQRTHWCCFERNKMYYQAKWGGLPGCEQFSSPFNR